MNKYSEKTESALKDIKIRLGNKGIKSELEKDINFNKAINAIDAYLKIGFNDTKNEEKTYNKVIHFMEKTNESHLIKLNTVAIIDSINYLIENAPNNHQGIFFDEVTDYDTLYQHDKLINEKISKLEDERLKTNGKLKDLEDELLNYKTSFQSLEAIQQNIEHIKTEYSHAKESVLSEIKLQKSYKFWESKGKASYSSYYIYFSISVVLSVLLVCCVFYFMNLHENKTMEVWKYGFLLLSTTLSIWLIKILIKITLSNYHLSIDASERVIMIRTYLSLLKEGKSFEKEDKKIMLDNIFRPTNFGIIQDETSVTITDIVSSLKK